MVNEEIKSTYQETDIQHDRFKHPSTKQFFPIMAGILLILAGILALVLWTMPFTIDVSTIESMMDISQYQEIDPTITPGKIKESLIICSTIECIFAVFVILGGILALKRKHWKISLTGGILGVFTIGFPPLSISTILSVVGIILIVLSKKEFQ